MNPTLDLILSHRLIAVLRLSTADVAAVLEVADAIIQGGIEIIEVTLTTPNALRIITELKGRSGIVVGAGSVLDAAALQQSIDAGAGFYASPVCNPDLLDIARNHNCATMPGGTTPNELLRAWEAGADIVKVFPMPADAVAYIKAVKAPLPFLRLAPSGGVHSESARQLLEAGSAALNVGSWLTHENGVLLSMEEIVRRSRALVQATSGQ